MKQRFSSLDIKVIAHELHAALVSLRITNIYDLSSRIFLFKLAKPDHRQQLLLDVGFRAHLTSFSRTAASQPSSFVTRLRKYLKTRRVTSVTQVGTDRILEIRFSEGTYRLFLEFYAGGNVVLTDRDLNILALQRTVTEGAEHEHVRPGGVYNLTERQNFNGVPEITRNRVREGLQKYADRLAKQATQPQTKSRFKRKTGEDLRKAVASCIYEYSPMLLDHSMRVCNLDVSIAPQDALKDDIIMDEIMKALGEAGRVMQDIMSRDVAKGYIIGRKKEVRTNPEASQNSSAADAVLYDDFHPFRPQHLVDDPSKTILEFDGFNKTVDEFFSSIEGQKLESRLQEKEEAARRKIEHARQDQEKRIGGLQQVQELNVRKAQAIEANLERVEEATAAINGLIAQGKDWIEIDRLVALERKRNNPVAEIIKLPLKLSENTATLLLGEWEVNEDEDGDVTESEASSSDSEDDNSKKEPKSEVKPLDDNRLAVDIDLSLSGWANAREYYDQKRSAAVKEEKTQQASVKALKNAQRKIEAELKKSLNQEKAVLRPTRQPFWFEKFLYFISSDGYLVLGGKDGLQQDTIYKRYFKKNDVFIHADLSGALPLIVKNRLDTPDAIIPPSTLSQAGNMSVATSTAWDSKAVMSAWWVSADKVTKVAPTGDFLPPGGFHVKGEKNYLPPAQLLLGFAILFQISEDSKARHLKHRIPLIGAKAEKLATEDESDLGPARETISANDIDNGTENESDDDSASNGSGDENADEDQRAISTRPNPLQSMAANQEDDDSEKEHQHETDDETNAKDRNATDAEIDQQSRGDDEPEDADESNIEEDEETHTTSTATPSVADTSASKPAKSVQVRGKKGKRKKIAQKYANQDEDDRAAAMELLGSKVGQERAAAEAAAKKAKEEEEAKAKERRRAQALKAQEAARRKEQARDAAEGQEEEEEDQQARQVDLESLVGMPLPGDEILEAIPICAPWSALGKYKYKVKLQPGSVKKGKAVREILGRWNKAATIKKAVDERSEDTERMWPREIELIKNWREESAFGVLPVSKVRVMMSGGQGGGGGGGGGGGKSGGGKGKGKR